MTDGSADSLIAQATDLVTLQEPSGGTARITAHGAHVLDWTPEPGGANQLFLSAKSALGAGASIRGGIPVIFPQFGEFGDLPKHGFARRSAWTLVDVQAAAASFELTESPATLAIWPHPFRLRLTVTLAARSLCCALTVENTGPQRARFTAGLHTYLRVPAIESVELQGLEGCPYWDATRAMAKAVQPDEPLRFGPELDRVYPKAPAAVAVVAADQRVRVESEGFQDIVVWNPGADKAAAMADMEPGGEQRMLCVEAAQIETPVELATGARWQGVQVLRKL